MRARPRHVRPDTGALAALVAAALALVGLLLAAPGARAADVDLIANGGFENGLASWSCTANSGQATNNQAHSGDWALLAAPTTSDDAQFKADIAAKHRAGKRVSSPSAVRTAPSRSPTRPPPPTSRAARTP
ncbi:hypothetical protein GCM10010430_46800 [Kitasatospora cystarginea]|uniref:Chitinase n=1 Tax=Kitasatospora cystarginea TaxID=58350 RepID=A0ABN3EFP9_9ACTN